MADKRANTVTQSAAACNWWSEIDASDLKFAALPCLLLGGLYAACCLADADLAISRQFYCIDSGRWPLADLEPWATLYHYGCKPAVIIGVVSLVLGLLGVMHRACRTCKAPCLFLAITLLVGPGLIVNGVLKPYVGRPRPYQTTDFGGDKPFAYAAASSVGNNSFPSGHASMGFYFMTPALLLYRRRPRIAAAVLAVGGTYGALIGFARIAQGAHFASDILGSAFIVYTTGVATVCGLWWVRRRREANQEQPDVLPMVRPESSVVDEQTRRAA